MLHPPEELSGIPLSLDDVARAGARLRHPLSLGKAMGRQWQKG